MTEIRKWKAGIADEGWKVQICQRDAANARKMLSYLHYILVGGDKTETEMLLDISRLSGIQIVDGIRGYILACEKSMETA